MCGRLPNTGEPVFVSAKAPTISSGAILGSLWVDTSATPHLKVCVSLSPLVYASMLYGQYGRVAQAGVAVCPNCQHEHKTDLGRACKATVVCAECKTQFDVDGVSVAGRWVGGHAPLKIQPIAGGTPAQT